MIILDILTPGCGYHVNSHYALFFDFSYSGRAIWQLPPSLPVAGSWCSWHHVCVSLGRQNRCLKVKAVAYVPARICELCSVDRETVPGMSSRSQSVGLPRQSCLFGGTLQ